MNGPGDSAGSGLGGSDFRLGYVPPMDVFDEMLGGGDHELRPLWHDIAGFLADLSVEEWHARWQRGQRVLRQHGVSYNVYSDDLSHTAAWRLDPVPLVLRADEWASLASALAQRATLLDLILRDLLGPQRLLSDGHIPPALVYGHPGFFRSTVSGNDGDRQRLFFYAADMARGADGRWRVMMDRTEAPTGFGYAMANRQAMTEIFPELLRRSEVRPVADFFSEIRRALQAAAPRGREDARIVVLTPGRRNETYFEHAFMARQLGCVLVEADDLTVRQGEVFLKTLQGLQQVDVIVRRLDTGYCDPLELRGDSALGVPGLTQAARQGSVGIVNTLGSGIVEQPGLMPFLPGLCRRMLGEDLRLPSVDTWWCGQPAERDIVSASLDEMVVKPAFPPEPGEPVFAGMASPDEREQLLTAITERPESHVGQELVRLSTAPTWSEHGLEPRSIMLRMLLCWTPGGWSVLPGGMVRVAPDRRARVVSMQRGGGAKDVWVLGAPGPGEAEASRKAARPVTIRRGRSNITSRAAENLYWFGRYLERATGMSRRVRGALRNVDHRLFPLATGVEAGVMQALLGSGVFRFRPVEESTLDDLARRACDVFTDASHPAALPSVFERLRQSADGLRYMMSVDSWLAVSRVQDALEAAQRSAAAGALMIEPIDDVVYALQALAGSINDTMPHSHGWRFHEMGRKLEISLQLVDLLAATLLRPESDSRLVLTTVLDITDCSAAYQERYRDETDLAAVLDLLICDQDHPKSLAFQLERLTGHVTHLSELQDPLPGEDRHVAIRNLAAVQLADARELAADDGNGRRPRLEQLLEILQGHLPRLDGAVSSRYFTHVAGRGRQRAIGLGDTIEGVA